MTTDSTVEIPQTQPARIEWIYRRAAMLDMVRGEAWVEDRLRKLWNNPDTFESGRLPGCPEGVDEKDYRLFQLGLLFGTEYEHANPRDDDE